MSTITLATPTNSAHGVMVTPPGLIRDSIKRKVDEALAEIEPGKSGAIVAVATRDGVNVVIAHKTPEGWEIAAWIGKNWSGKTDAGVQVKKSWR